MDQFISKEVLDILSYHSTLGRSLKQISLRKTPLPIILDDIEKYRASYIDTIFQENLIGSRFKSEDSIKRKYEKTLKTGGGFKQCFNDILGFRLKFEEYPREYPDYFRVVDLRNGKDIEQFIYIIKEIIWSIQLKYNFGAERIIYLTYGVINMYINIKIQK